MSYVVPATEKYGTAMGHGQTRHHPSHKSGVEFDWAGLTARNRISTNPVLSSPDLQYQVALLMERSGHHLNTVYSCNFGSGTSGMGGLTDLISSFTFYDLWDEFHYSHNNWEDYSLGGVLPDLVQGYPILMAGYSKMGSFLGIDFPSGGHIWVCDGQWQRRRTQTIYNDYYKDGKLVLRKTFESYDRAYYLHHNWGWDGDDNNWFEAGIFNPDQHANVPSSRVSDNFKYKTKFISNIRPK